MTFDPNRHVSASSGSFNVDISGLCATHTLITHEENLSIEPACLAFSAVLAEADLVSLFALETAVGLIPAISAVISTLDSLESSANDPRWKMQDATLTYADASVVAPLQGAVPGSPSGARLSWWNLEAFALSPGGALAAGDVAFYHGFQNVFASAEMLWLPVVPLSKMTAMIRGRDLWNTAIDGASFALYRDEESGALFQRDLGRLALDVNSLPALRGVTQSLTGQGVSQNLNLTSTQPASGIAAPAVPWAVAALYNRMGCGHGVNYGVAVRGTDRDARIHHSEAAARIPSGVLDARTQVALVAMPDATPDTHHEDITISADAIEHIADMYGNNADNRETVIEEHVTMGEDGVTTRPWTVSIRGTRSFIIGWPGPQDMTTNLRDVAGMASDQFDTIMEAMDAVSITPKEAVELSGYSQGGITAAQLATNPAVRARHNVVSVITAGSFTATVAPGDAPVFSYEGSDDIVSGLDGSTTRGDSVTTARFHDYEATARPKDPIPSSHSTLLYVDKIRSTLDAVRVSFDSGLSALATAEVRCTQVFSLTQDTQTTIHHYRIRCTTQG